MVVTFPRHYTGADFLTLSSLSFTPSILSSNSSVLLPMRLFLPPTIIHLLPSPSSVNQQTYIPLPTFSSPSLSSQEFPLVTLRFHRLWDDDYDFKTVLDDPHHPTRLPTPLSEVYIPFRLICLPGFRSPSSLPVPITRLSISLPHTYYHTTLPSSTYLLGFRSTPVSHQRFPPPKSPIAQVTFWSIAFIPLLLPMLVTSLALAYATSLVLTSPILLSSPLHITVPATYLQTYLQTSRTCQLTLTFLLYLYIPSLHSKTQNLHYT